MFFEKVLWIFSYLGSFIVLEMICFDFLNLFQGRVYLKLNLIKGMLYNRSLRIMLKSGVSVMYKNLMGLLMGFFQMVSVKGKFYRFLFCIYTFLRYL